MGKGGNLRVFFLNIGQALLHAAITDVTARLDKVFHIGRDVPEIWDVTEEPRMTEADGTTRHVWTGIEIPVLGPILFQLPPNMQADVELLRAFLAGLPSDVRPAFEFRHDTWDTPETREVLAPMKTITENLRTASTNLVEIGISAREQFKRVEHMVAETGEVLHTQLGRIDAMTRDVVDRVNSTALVVQDSFLRPAREVAAIAKGFGRGLETLLFRRQKNTVDQAHQDEELFI